MKDSSRRDEPPEGSNSELVKEFFAKVSAGRKKWVVPEKTFCK